MRNPHFDDNRLVWSDSFSGEYQPTAYDAQFDEKWSLVLRDADFNVGAGARTDDANIDRLAAEWQSKFDDGLIADKKCMDAGCGSGRWTRVMQALGAESVLSVDMSPASLESVARYNPNTLAADLTSLADDHPELQFDFVNLWGVAHHTHDPRLTVKQVAKTVAPGGAMYLMLYNPAGQHGTRETNELRRIFSTLPADERMAFLATVVDRRWSPAIPLRWNIKNQLRNLRGQARGHKAGTLDLLSPFYNWTVPRGVVKGWLRSSGFTRIKVLTPPDSRDAGIHYLALDKV